MTKFETRGVELQQSSLSQVEADKKFEYSCGCCCTHGMHIDCERCAIAHCHSLMTAIFADKKKGGENA